MSEIFSILELCFTSWPIYIVLLVLIIGFFTYWFFKVRPQEKEREEAREEANRKRESDFLQAMTRSDENAKNTIVMYEKALDNSTRAIENNTAALNMMSVEMKHLRDTSESHDESLEKVELQTQKTNENMVKVITLLENRDK